jgi:hypothetical protein
VKLHEEGSRVLFEAHLPVGYVVLQGTIKEIRTASQEYVITASVNTRSDPPAYDKHGWPMFQHEDMEFVVKWEEVGSE